MKKALIIGGTGQIGLTTAQYLQARAWDVTITSRHNHNAPPDIRHITADPKDAATLRALTGTDTDLILSCVAFDDDDARILADAGRDARHIVAISSASVYCDDAGRTLDEAADNGFPQFTNPLTEQNPTVPAGPATYSTRKVAMEQRLLTAAAGKATILRPCAIHGPHSKHAREWWFIKRLLDGRREIPLAYNGQSRFQTTSTAAIAAAVERAVNDELPPIANVADADCPTVTAIGQTIMAIMGIEAAIIGLPTPATYPAPQGRSPWSLQYPMICAGAAQTAIPYAAAVKPAIDWLRENIRTDDWRNALPQLAAYPYDHFDYEADDAALREAA